MGTPDFAVESLKVLVDNGYNVVAVVTMPDKPSGRGHKVQFSAVKQYALSVGLPVLQPEKLKAEEFLRELRAYNADLQIVVAFRMLPEVVWAMPRFGTFNLHASLLPQYRGAAPLNWAIINGEKETGVTTFFLKQEIDTGDMILQQRVPIEKTDDVGILHDKLMTIGANMVLQTVDMILEGNVSRTPQPVIPANELKPAPKIFKETCEIDFSQPAEQIYNFVRGLSPYPAAWATLQLGSQEETVKIFKVAYEEDDKPMTVAPKTVRTDYKTYLKIACLNGWIDILELQLPGKKRLAIRDVLNGLH